MIRLEGVDLLLEQLLLVDLLLVDLTDEIILVLNPVSLLLLSLIGLELKKLLLFLLGSHLLDVLSDELVYVA